MAQPYLNHVKTPSLFLGSDREMVLYIREMCLRSSQQVVRSPILMYPGCLIKFKKNLSKSLQSAALNRHLLCIHQQPREIGSCFHSVSSSPVRILLLMHPYSASIKRFTRCYSHERSVQALFPFLYWPYRLSCITGMKPKVTGLLPGGMLVDPHRNLSLAAPSNH